MRWGQTPFLLAALLWSGCLPLPTPHFHQFAPEVDGFVHRGGEPVPDFELRWQASWGDSSLDASGRSDSAGRFHFDGKRRFHPGSVIRLLGLPHYSYRWDLCFDATSEDVACWHGSLYTPARSPRRLVVDCDLAREIETAETNPDEGGTSRNPEDLFCVGRIDDPEDEEE